MKKKAAVKPIDRRIIKTKQILFDALMNLIIEKGYESVSIQDIIDRANVGRSTFYSHYENKEQLLFSGDDTIHKILLSDEFQQMKGKKYSSKDKFKLVYEHVAKHAKVTRALLGGRGATPMLEHAHSMMTLIIKGESALLNKEKIDKKMQNYLMSATAAALVKLLTSWLDDDMKFDTELMSKRSDRIIRAIL